VAAIEAEQALVAANRELIARFEQKIQATLARIGARMERSWGRGDVAVVRTFTEAVNASAGYSRRHLLLGNAHLPEAPRPHAAPASSGGIPLEKPVFP
jgi:histidinol dehydrogenase